ncbi:winged helix-turn-helix domain-containing protein [Pseudorhodobacter turbinis]|uniref:Winged helix-turn-helix domain-containing protein n=1 Tax=Pseudorhodobacter turbinis TaxID=2500533 RepID=A0A4P8EH97_9RHOB|nr:crosslink repair DNA glycosylase YcaQ family protein [Pseudorhodobacter turbinis]QCO56142.1 winged helix-turn-helix domain-containing protein [Pseudorhodobacter turbinis]
MSIPRLENPCARRVFLHHHGLGTTPTGPAKGADLAGLIDQLGFVQVDSIRTVARAHDLILFSRRQNYQPSALKQLLEKDRALFEHWTHDAAILPAHLFPHWQHRFARDATRLEQGWKRWFRDGYEEQFETILDRIRKDGPVTTSDVGQGEARSKGGWWDWHPSKTALEWLWRTGVLSIAGRDGFQKIYDLTERVIPAAHRLPAPDMAAHHDWACLSALQRLGFATAGELAAFWAAIPNAAARDWCAKALKQGRIKEVDIEAADGSLRRSFMLPGTLTADLAPAPPRIRILSPFDPALRDRARAERLFGFRYRIEVFVPQAKRQYGYYVFPVLEGERIIGRIDAKAYRDDGTLRVRAFWPEAGITMGKGRLSRLEDALTRLARFADCPTVEFAADWLR